MRESSNTTARSSVDPYVAHEAILSNYTSRIQAVSISPGPSFACSTRRPAHHPPAKNVKMEMAHTLPRVRPRVHNNAVTALTQAFPLGQFSREPKRPARKLVVARIQMAQAGNMFPRYYEHVYRRLGVDVAKRH